VFPSRLPEIAGTALLAAAFLMFVARPVAVYLGLWRSGFTMRERTLVAWTGLRGAVPIVLATFPFTAGYEHSDTMFSIVFFIVLASVLLQGKTLMIVARWLKVDAPLLARPKSPIEFEGDDGIQSETREIEIPPESSAVGQHVAVLGLPPDVLILLVRRGQGFLVPKGATVLEAFDTLMLIGPPEELTDAQTLLLTPRVSSESSSDKPAAPPAGTPQASPGGR
jgi:cell volume regulation protein A